MIQDPEFRKPKSAKLLEHLKLAKKQGWAKHIRQGAGQEADEKAILAGCRFDQTRADHVVSFFEEFGVLTEGAWKGKPFHLLDWEHDWLSKAFGWVHYSKQWKMWVRRFRYLYLEVAKKNGKTPLLATLGNYLLFADSYGRQINQHLAATTRKQAQRCIVHAIRALKYRPALAELAITKKLEGFYSVEFGDNLWTCLAADAASADGVNGHVLADELHRWVGLEFYQSILWAIAGQPEGIFAGITTAGSNMESACRTCHEKTRAVNSGHQSDQQWFGKIFAAEKDDDPHEEETWFKANPSLGTTPKHPLKLESFRADYESAKSDPTQWPAWQQLRLNLWRTAEDAWMPIEHWDMGEIARERSTERIDCFEDFDRNSHDWKSLESVMAFDGATTRDTTAVAFTFEHPEEAGVLLTIPYYWLPEARARQLQDRVPFEQWSKAGLITLTPGDAVDFTKVYNDLVLLMEFYGIEQFYFDPLFQAEWLTQKLEEETGAVRFEFPQTVLNYSPAMKTAERMILERTLRHNGHPILNWQFGQTKAKHNANDDIRPVKQKHGDYRTIDGVQCVIMTIRNWLTVEAGSYYDDNELEVI